MKYRNAILTLALVAFLFTPIAVGAFGVSPPWINESKLVPGITYTKQIWLTRSDKSQDLPVRAEFDVPEEIEKWFSIDRGLEFSIPEGTQQFPIEVTIDVPKSADLGIYKGALRIATHPKEQEGEEGGGQVTIATGVRVDVNISVGDDIVREFEVKNMSNQSENVRVSPK